MKTGLFEVLDVVFRDYVSKEPVFIFDTLKMSNIEVTGERQEQTGGKGNSVLYVVDHSRKVNLNITDALISMTSLALLAGKNGPTKGQRVLTGRKEFSFNEQALAGNTGKVPGTGAGEGAEFIVDDVLGGVAADDSLVFTIAEVTSGGAKAYTVALTTGDDTNTVVDKIVQQINNTSNKVIQASNAGTTITLTALTNGSATISRKDTVAITFEPNTTGVTITETKMNFSGGQAPTLPQVKVVLDQTPLAEGIYYINKEDEVILVDSANIDIATKTVTLDPAAGLSGTLIYRYTAASTRYVTISSDSFPGYFEVEGWTVKVDQCSGEMRELIVRIPKAKLDSNFTIELNADATPAEFAFGLTSIKECEGKDLIEFIEVEEV